MTSTAAPLPASGGRRRNLLDLTSREWGRSEHRRRSHKLWMIAVGSLAFTGLGFVLVVAGHKN